MTLLGGLARARSSHEPCGRDALVVALRAGTLPLLSVRCSVVSVFIPIGEFDVETLNRLQTTFMLGGVLYSVEQLYRCDLLRLSPSSEVSCNLTAAVHVRACDCRHVNRCPGPLRRGSVRAALPLVR